MFFNKGGAANRALLCQRADTSTLFDVGVAPFNEAVTNNTELFSKYKQSSDEIFFEVLTES